MGNDYIYISPKLRRLGAQWLDSVPILLRYVCPSDMMSFNKLTLWG